MSCKLISEDMTLVIINEETMEATKASLTTKLRAIQAQAGGAEQESLALVIDGRSLTFALEKGLDKTFLDLAVLCKALICWYFPQKFLTAFMLLISTAVVCLLCKRRWLSSLLKEIFPV